MIAFLKAWIFLIIIFQNHIFMNYINYSYQNNQSSINQKVFMIFYSIFLLFLAATAQTTYQTLFKF